MLQRALWNILTARGPKPWGVSAGIIVAVGLWAAVSLVIVTRLGIGEG